MQRDIQKFAAHQLPDLHSVTQQQHQQ